MKDQVKNDRFEKLKSMRQQLCDRERAKLNNASHEKWLLDQFEELKKLSECKDCTVESIREKIDEIVKEISNSGSRK